MAEATAPPRPDLPQRSPDQELVDALLAGEESAVRQLRHLIARAAGSFRGRLAAEWDDLLQDLFIEVLGELRRGRFGGGSLPAFAGRIVVRTCIDRTRRQRRWRFSDLGEVEEPKVKMHDLPTFLALRALVSKMPAECRRLWRRIVEGYTYAEMSDELGVSAGTLRVRVLRCREQARELRRTVHDSGEES